MNTANQPRFGKHLIATTVATLLFTGCSSFESREFQTYSDAEQIASLLPAGETQPVASTDDAADDPAIWVNQANPSQSYIVGTDKRAGLGVYRLDGSLHSFLPYGLPNNVDIRQNVTLTDSAMDYVAVSDRADNSIGLLHIDANGLTPLTAFASKVEPYGFCLGSSANTLYAIVTYKDGLVEQYTIRHDGEYQASLSASYQLPSQLEGCVMNDSTGQLFVGEEAQGVWLFENAFGTLDNPKLIIDINDGNGMQADVEGVALYKDKLLISSQGNDSYAVYQNAAPYDFVQRFRVVPNGDIDAAQETDGIDATSAFLGEAFPTGILVVQDGFNRSKTGQKTTQNFKIVSAEF